MPIIGRVPTPEIVDESRLAPQHGNRIVDPSSPENADLAGIGTATPVAKIGVFGSSTTNVGVYAHSDSYVGFFASGGRLAGLFEGNVQCKGNFYVTGNLTIQGVSIQQWLQEILQLKQDVADLQQLIAARFPPRTPTPPPPSHPHPNGPTG